MRRHILLLALAVVAVQGLQVERNGKWTVGKGAVTSNGKECAQIGRDLLAKGGSAVDAIIGVCLCEGLTGPQSMGIGGGFLATIYSKETGEVKSLVAREMAPKDAFTTMFQPKENVTGGKAAAIPGEIKGYWELHQKYGKLNWSLLFEPAIKLCNDGVPVDAFLNRTLAHYKSYVENSTSLRKYYWNDATDTTKKLGDIIKYPTLAKTFRKIADGGARVIYGDSPAGPVGEVGKDLIQDIRELGGIMTENDLANYTVIWADPVTTKLPNGHRLYTIPIPGSGAILAYILNLVKGRVENIKDEAVRWQRIIEAFKHGYGYRSQMVDPKFDRTMDNMVKKITSEEYAAQIIKKIDDHQTSNDYRDYNGKFGVDDHGTSNIAVLAPNGDAVTLTSTINNIFGARVVSEKTGIILNDEMDDFSIPGKENSYGFAPSPSNYIKPFKRPVSSMTPSIILDSNGNVRLLIGAAGGSQITTSVALTTIRHLFLGQSLERSIGDLRLHHQLLPMEVRFEDFDKPFDQGIINELKAMGHNTTRIPTILGFGAVTGIAVQNNNVDPQNEKRRGGSVAVIDASEVKA